MNPTREIPWRDWYRAEAARRGITESALLKLYERGKEKMPRRRKVNSRVIYVLI